MNLMDENRMLPFDLLIVVLRIASISRHQFNHKQKTRAKIQTKLLTQTQFLYLVFRSPFDSSIFAAFLVLRNTLFMNVIADQRI